MLCFAQNTKRIWTWNVGDKRGDIFSKGGLEGSFYKIYLQRKALYKNKNSESTAGSWRVCTDSFKIWRSRQVLFPALVLMLGKRLEAESTQSKLATCSQLWMPQIMAVLPSFTMEDATLLQAQLCLFVGFFVGFFFFSPREQQYSDRRRGNSFKLEDERFR